jgi:hypothetical protein
MRKLILPVFLLFVLFACNMDKMGPIEYNDAIVGEQTKITQKFLELINSVESDLDKCEPLRLDIIKQCDESIAVVSAMSDYNGSTRMRDAALALFHFYKEINMNEYKEMLEILKKGEEMNIDDITRLTELEQQITGRETGLDAEFQSAQQEFAAQNNIQIRENELQKEIGAI